MLLATYLVSLAGRTADQLRWAERPWQSWPNVTLGSLGPRELVRLGPALGAGDPDELILDCSLLAGESQDSPWVVSLPPTLVAGLEAVAPAATEAVAARWVLDDELAAGRDPRELLGSFARMVSFVQSQEGPFVLYVRRVPATV